MNYRRLGKTNLNISIIAYGGLPLFFETTDRAIQSIHAALDEGVNYFDLDEAGNQFIPEKVYLDGGSKIGTVLKERRKDCYLGVKSMRQTYDEVREDVKLALQRIVKGTAREVVDIFQLAFLDTPQKMEVVLSKDGGLRALEEAREEGVIDYILGAAHNPRSMLQIINSERFDAIMFPFNIIEDEYTRKVLPLARQKDIGTIVMKPVGGGQLGSVAEYSLRWILTHDVTSAIPGMRNEQEVKKNTRIAHELQPLSAEEYEALKQAGERIGKEYCHRCGYCLPCTQGILILGVMDFLKSSLLPIEKKRAAYNNIIRRKVSSPASSCIKCGECVARCPFKLPIPELMEQAAAMLEKEK
jgi:predicted aldo/keto reductase-like oxidoreductase